MYRGTDSGFIQGYGFRIHALCVQGYGFRIHTGVRIQDSVSAIYLCRESSGFRVTGFRMQRGQNTLIKSNQNTTVEQKKKKKTSRKSCLGLRV